MRAGIQKLRITEPSVKLVFKEISWESTRDAEFTEAFAIPPASWVHPFKLRGRTGRGRSTIRQSLISPSAAYSCITECGSSTELKALMSAKKAQTVGARACDLASCDQLARPDLTFFLCRDRDDMTALLASKGQQLWMRPNVGLPAVQFHGPLAQFATGWCKACFRGSSHFLSLEFGSLIAIMGVNWLGTNCKLPNGIAVS